jgi:hypothetical protein
VRLSAASSSAVPGRECTTLESGYLVLPDALSQGLRCPAHAPVSMQTGDRGPLLHSRRFALPHGVFAESSGAIVAPARSDVDRRARAARTMRAALARVGGSSRERTE